MPCNATSLQGEDKFAKKAIDTFADTAGVLSMSETVSSREDAADDVSAGVVELAHATRTCMGQRQLIDRPCMALIIMTHASGVLHARHYCSLPHPPSDQHGFAMCGIGGQRPAHVPSRPPPTARFTSWPPPTHTAVHTLMRAFLPAHGAFCTARPASTAVAH